MKTTTTKITEDLYEIITGLSGYRDKEHSEWEKEAKRHLKTLTSGKNISLDYEKNTIEIQNSEGNRTFYKITITKYE